MSAFAALSGSSGDQALWYLTRGTGVTALLLLSAVTVLGILDVRRVATARYPRFLIDAAHQRLAALALVFLVIHIATVVLDPFVAISWLDVVVPFVGSYRPVWLGLGALALDLLLAVMVSSLLRARVGYRAWRAIHWLAYASWPVAVAHTLGIGTDASTGWLLIVTAICVVAVLTAVAVRVATRLQGRARKPVGVIRDDA